MRREGHNPSTYHYPRGTVESFRLASAYASATNGRSEGYKGYKQYVPGFNVRRPVIVTPGLTEFWEATQAALHTTHFNVKDAELFALTSFAKQSTTRTFREIGELPPVKQMHKTAEIVAYDIGEKLVEDKVAEAIDLPLGDIQVFGKNALFGVMPEAWQQIQVVEQGESTGSTEMELLVSESNMAVTGLRRSFDHFLGFNEQLERFTRNRNYHVTLVGRHQANGELTNKEVQRTAAVIDDHLPGSFVLGDPVMEVWLDSKQLEPIILHPRAHYLEESV